MISIEYREAMVEILDILQNSDDEIIEKIPSNLIDFWQENKSKTYKPNLDHSKTLLEMELKEKTKSLITMVYTKYLCDGKQKEQINTILKNNEKKYQQKLKIKYNYDDIFNSNNKQIKKNEEQNNTVNIVEYKESIFRKIINYFKRIF